MQKPLSYRQIKGRFPEKDNTDKTDNTGNTENTVKKGTTISNSKAAYIVTNTEKKTVVYKVGKTKEKR